MERLTLKVPFSFIAAKLGRPTWQDVLFGLENGLIDPKAASRLAEVSLESSDPPREVIQVALAEPGASIIDDVRTLADGEKRDRDATVARWLYLVLAWLYEHRSELRDPLQVVETVYADFDYPQEMARFVRYMPSDDPDLGDRKANESRLMSNWRRYLCQVQRRLSEPT